MYTTHKYFNKSTERTGHIFAVHRFTTMCLSLLTQMNYTISVDVSKDISQWILIMKGKWTFNVSSWLTNYSVSDISKSQLIVTPNYTTKMVNGLKTNKNLAEQQSVCVTNIFKNVTKLTRNDYTIGVELVSYPFHKRK